MHKRKYQKLSFEDRKVIQGMVKKQCSAREIADTVGVHSSTIYNELRRCPHGEYDALQAQCGVR